MFQIMQHKGKYNIRVCVLCIALPPNLLHIFGCIAQHKIPLMKIEIVEAFDDACIIA